MTVALSHSPGLFKSKFSFSISLSFCLSNIIPIFPFLFPAKLHRPQKPTEGTRSMLPWVGQQSPRRSVLRGQGVANWQVLAPGKGQAAGPCEGLSAHRAAASTVMAPLAGGGEGLLGSRSRVNPEPGTGDWGRPRPENGPFSQTGVPGPGNKLHHPPPLFSVGSSVTYAQGRCSEGECNVHSKGSWVPEPPAVSNPAL